INKHLNSSVKTSGSLAALLLLMAAAPAWSFDQEQWTVFTRTGQRAYDSQSWGPAEKNFLAALDQLKGATDAEKSQYLADSLANLGMLYSGRGQFAKAESFFEKSLKVREYVLGAHDKVTIANQVKLCQLYLNLGKRDKAMVIVDKLADYGEAQSRELAEVSNSFAKLQSFYQQHKKLEKTARVMKEAEEATLKETKDQCQEIAILLDGVANSIKDITTAHSRHQAERLYKSALALRQRTLTPEHAALASSLENLGKLYLAEGKTTRAEPLLRNAYEISVKTLGPERAETLIRLDCLAQVLTSSGKLGEAETLYRKVLDVDKGGSAKGSRSQADMCSNLAALLVKQGRYAESVPYYSRALKIQEGINGPQSASLANLLDSYAYALSKANRGAEAKKLSARAKSIRG
ncbi:MAG: tetratricopeptide repeat protein, partial [Cyanobacteria bacterium SZAS TMP-1]|nr:tetratricopeptide repeat protein [Cyanobacteria bacterium SZAS TMP-1]